MYNLAIEFLLSAAKHRRLRPFLSERPSGARRWRRCRGSRRARARSNAPDKSRGGIIGRLWRGSVHAMRSPTASRPRASRIVSLVLYLRARSHDRRDVCPYVSQPARRRSSRHTATAPTTVSALLQLACYSYFLIFF